MNNEKLKAHEVPQKFAEWLLDMGCLADKIPSTDKLAEMCRGQYYIVWRSLMEHVQPKDIIKEKKLQVFVKDMQKCQSDSNFIEQNSVVVPLELSLWREQRELKEKLAVMEAKVNQLLSTTKQNVKKASVKLNKRNQSRRRLKDSQRNVWFLQHVLEDLEVKKANLEEIKSIAVALSPTEIDDDVQIKMDACVSVLRRPSTRTHASHSALSDDSSSVSTNENNIEEKISSLTKCGAETVWMELIKRRKALGDALRAAYCVETKSDDASVTPQSITARTAALHSALVIDAIKSQVIVKNTRKRFAAAIAQLGTLSSEEKELVVARCERARCQARIEATRKIQQELTSRAGVFTLPGGTISNGTVHVQQTHEIDAAIMSKKKDLQEYLHSMSTIEMKTQLMKDCVLSLLNDMPIEIDKYAVLSLDMPKEALSYLHQFYEELRNKRNGNIQFSKQLDMSNRSFTDSFDNYYPKFTDELRFYLNNFNLNKNRKIVLDGGEKIWLSETLSESAERAPLGALTASQQIRSLYARLTQLNAARKRDARAAFKPFVIDSLTVQLGKWLPSSITQTTPQALQARCRPEMGSGIPYSTSEIQQHTLFNNFTVVFCNDLIPAKEEEEQAIDSIKKKLNENILSLQKTSRATDVCGEYLELWSQNDFKKYISSSRTINGMNYEQYLKNINK